MKKRTICVWGRVYVCALPDYFSSLFKVSTMILLFLQLKKDTRTHTQGTRLFLNVLLRGKKKRLHETQPIPMRNTLGQACDLFRPPKPLCKQRRERQAAIPLHRAGPLPALNRTGPAIRATASTCQAGIGARESLMARLLYYVASIWKQISFPRQLPKHQHQATEHQPPRT